MAFEKRSTQVSNGEVKIPFDMHEGDMRIRYKVSDMWHAIKLVSEVENEVIQLSIEILDACLDCRLP